jgi:hypothetical protein
MKLRGRTGECGNNNFNPGNYTNSNNHSNNRSGGNNTGRCRFDENYGPEKRVAAPTTHSYGIDTTSFLELEQFLLTIKSLWFLLAQKAL